MVKAWLIQGSFSHQVPELVSGPGRSALLVPWEGFFSKELRAWTTSRQLCSNRSCNPCKGRTNCTTWVRVPLPDASVPKDVKEPPATLTAPNCCLDNNPGLNWLYLNTLPKGPEEPTGWNEKVDEPSEDWMVAGSWGKDTGVLEAHKQWSLWYHLHGTECVQRLHLGVILDDLLVCLLNQRNVYKGYGGVLSVDGVEDALRADLCLGCKGCLQSWCHPVMAAHREADLTPLHTPLALGAYSSTSDHVRSCKYLNIN